MIKRLSLFIIVTAGLSVFLSGCGYSTSSALPSRLRRIHVEEFKNKINFTDENRRGLYFPLLETDIRTAVVDRFVFDGNLRITDPDSANLILKGDLVDYVRSALRYTDNDDPEEYRIQIVVNLTMVDNDNGEVYWVENGFVGEAEYFIVGPQVSTEEAAVNEAIEDLARRIVERTIEDW